MGVYDAAMADIFRDEDMTVAASYRLPPYTAQSVRVIISQPTDAFGASVAGTMQADILAADVTDAPERGAELTIAGTTYKVEQVERDVLGLSWRLALSKPATD
jgi:hypothetical protein